MSRYGHLTRTDLEFRLAMAEDCCIMFGWCGVRDQDQREKATLELWMRWHHLPGVSTDPADHPELAASEADLARQRDATRAATLAKLFGPDEEATP